MAFKVGAGIALDGEKEYRQAVAEINKSMAVLGSEMGKVSAAFENGGSKIQGLASKTEVYNKQIEEQKKKIGTLKAALENSAKEFGENDTKTKNWQISLNKAEGELSKLEKGLKDTKEEASKLAGVNFEKLSDGLTKAGEKATAAGKAFAPISAAAAAAVAGLGAMAVKAGKTSDDLNTLAKQTGLTTEQIQKFKFASEMIDVSFETVSGSMRKLTKNMDTARKGTGDAADAFKKLHVRITGAGGQLRNNEDVFYDTIDALGKVRNETERDAMAMAIFGKSAQDLNPLILGGAEALKKYGKEAQDKGLIIPQDALDAANEFNDYLDEMKAKLSASFFKAGAELAKALTPLMEKLAKAVEKIAIWIGKLDGDTIVFIGTILGVVAVISPLLMVIGKIAFGINQLIVLWPVLAAAAGGIIPLFTAIAGAISGVLTGAITFFTGTVIPGLIAAITAIGAPIIIAVAAVAAVVAAIVLFGDEIKAALQKLDDWLQGVFSKDWTEVFGIFGEVVNGWMENIKNVWDGIKGIFDGIIDFVKGTFSGNWERAWKGIKEIFKGIWDTLAGIVKAPFNMIISMTNAVIKSINKVFNWANGLKWPDFLGGGSVGFNFKPIGEIPLLAKGGTLSQGSAIVGEAGAELLTVKSGKAIVQPLTGRNAVAPASGNQSNYYNFSLSADTLQTVADFERTVRGARMAGRAY